MPTTPKLPIDLQPIPGFCIKSTAVNPATLLPFARPEHDNTLGPTAPIMVPAGRKVFINICYDKNVPSPPPADENTIKRAMSVQEVDDDAYYVPVVVSQPREDQDKAGKPSLVFDCVFNSTLRSRVLRDSEFKIFLVELALQRIEAQTSLVFSRQIGTPNISSKGKLEPRRVWVPAWLATGQRVPLEGQSRGDDKEEKKLIEVMELPADGGKKGDSASPLPKLKGILKSNRSANTTGIATKKDDDVALFHNSSQTNRPERVTWSWRKEDNGGLIIIIDVPKGIPREVIAGATLDVEARRLILRVPGSAKSSPLELDIDLSKSDAEIVASVPGPAAALSIHGNEIDDRMKEPNSTLLLKRQKDFDVDGASAEWRVAEGKLFIHV